MTNCETAAQPAGLTQEERDQAEALFLKFKEPIYRYLRGKLPDAQTTEELVSQVFFKMVRAFRSYRGEPEGYGTWIYTIARNTLTDHYRAQGGGRELPLEAAENRAGPKGHLPEEQLMTRARLERLAQMLETLPQRERDILILRFYHGRTPRETAELMGLSYVNAKVLQSRAVARLRKLAGGGADALL